MANDIAKMKDTLCECKDAACVAPLMKKIQDGAYELQKAAPDAAPTKQAVDAAIQAQGCSTRIETAAAK